MSSPNYSCGICLEVYEQPVRLECQHVFCQSCIAGNPTAVCPMCRRAVNMAALKPAVTLSIEMDTVRANCEHCHKKFLVKHLRQHGQSCSKRVSAVPTFKPIAPTSQKVKNIPNRSTFKCPYCSTSNLDCKALAAHCIENHSNDRKKVVCPVCVSMPWGNPSQQSSNFIQHVRARHQFEYETYVKYDQDEDAVLQAVLQESLHEQ